MTDAAHQDLIRDQFTRQATPFSTAAPIANEAALKLIIDAARPAPEAHNVPPRAQQASEGDAGSAPEDGQPP